MMAGLFDLTGRTALLTGASRGMGLEMARALARCGARVVISSRKQDAVDAAAAAINDECGPDRAHGVAANAGRQGDLVALVEAARRLAGPVDIVIGNAGVLASCHQSSSSTRRIPADLTSFLFPNGVKTVGSNRLASIPSVRRSQ